LSDVTHETGKAVLECEFKVVTVNVTKARKKKEEGEMEL
jgi:hypothetical protein